MKAINTTRLLEEIRETADILGLEAIKGDFTRVHTGVKELNGDWMASVTVEVVGNLQVKLDDEDPEIVRDMSVQVLGTLSFSGRPEANLDYAIFSLHETLFYRVKAIGQQMQRLEKGMESSRDLFRGTLPKEDAIEDAVLTTLFSSERPDPVLEDAWTPQKEDQATVPDLLPGLKTVLITRPK